MKQTFLRSVLVTGIVLCTCPAFAINKLYTPYVSRGEWEAEYFGTVSNDSNNAKDDAQKHQLSLGYGVTDFWKTELYASFEKEPGNSLTFDSWEWENIFQFTQQGQYWLDVGGSLAYEWTPQSDHANKIEARLILAKNIGQTFHVLNLIAEKDIGSGPREHLEGGFIWSSRYNYNHRFQPGFEIHSDFGELRETGRFSDQSHYIGPLAYGTIPIPFTDEEEDEGLEYRAGYLFGISDAAANGQFVLQLEYEIEF